MFRQPGNPLLSGAGAGAGAGAGVGGTGTGGGFQSTACFSQNKIFTSPANPQFPFNPQLQNPIFFQNPYLQFPYLQNPTLPSFNPSPGPQRIHERAESAAAKVRQDLVASGESVSAWKVSQATLVHLKADSWSSLGFQLQDVPTLHHLLVIEGKIHAFIHCFVNARRITTLYDLELAICKNEGIERFEELGLGPLLRHPLVEHYFSVPADVTETFRITSEDIIGNLREYLSKIRKKMITMEEFLDYVAEQKSVSSKERLGVRIRSLGLHISHIREAKRMEVSALSKISDIISQNPSSKKGLEKNNASQPPCRFLEKEMLDRRFGFMSKRMKLFSSSLDNFGGKHIRFDSSDENNDSAAEDGEDDLSTCQYRGFSNGKVSGQHVSSCPYPSTTEEMVRLGLKVEGEKPSLGNGKSLRNIGKKSSDKKRKFEEKNGNINYSCRLPENEQVIDSTVCQKRPISLTLSNEEMVKFITKWKEVCQEHTIPEVVDMMLDCYVAKMKRKRKIKKILSSYPAAGLLNVAVTSIKCGMLDSIYDAVQDIGANGCIDQNSGPSVEMIDIVRTFKEDTVPQGDKELGITVDDIIKKVTEYFELHHSAYSKQDLPLWKEFGFLKKFHDCEAWLTSLYSVKAFSCFGHGNFCDFFEKYSSLLPRELHNSLSRGFDEQFCGGVAMLQEQLRVFLSQTTRNSTDGDDITKKISMLLKKQFPIICLRIMGNEPEKCFLDLIDKQPSINHSGSVIFSSTLLGKSYTVNNAICCQCPPSELAGFFHKVAHHTCSHATISAKDAIECLLKAPMLSDLLSWSHWDVIYAPTLGSLMEWLLNDVHAAELSCIATIDGKFVRIDPSTTMDGFLEALIQCSSFQVALKFLSLLYIFKGSDNAPLSLMKCYVQRAIDVIMRNSIDNAERETSVASLVQSNQLEQGSLDKYAKANPPITFLGTREVLTQGNALSKNLLRANDVVDFMSRFIVDCLRRLPSEFRCFAADILVSALRSVTKDAHLVILRQCFQSDDRVMLHEIGLSLGVTEWIDDFRVFSSASTNDFSLSSKTFCAKTGLSCAAAGMHAIDASEKSVSRIPIVVAGADGNSESVDEVHMTRNEANLVVECEGLGHVPRCEDMYDDNCENSENEKRRDATLIIESIRREEFGLDSNLNYDVSSLLKKQHVRLGRALHCLSRDLYSQDSHLLLELVQNADDNAYLDNVDPTLVFILQDTGIIVLNNEQGFSAENIKAICDIGSSTKKGSVAGYIGNKGIGFKSVFRVTDAPEIHSNGFHVKFDITEGEIGFILPTVVSACDVNMFQELLPGDECKSDNGFWNTCILLPFRSRSKKETSMNSIIRMFQDLHPSLLLFLHRLRCIKFRNMLDNSFIVMKKETLGDGIIKVSYGNAEMSWLVVNKRLRASAVRSDVQNTEIAMAFTLQESEGEYEPYLIQQPVFAFLPLRTYGLKFIIQGNFVLPSSREEVDGDSAWNQWLLTEFPDLFVSAEESFCKLHCFQRNPGKAVTVYMSFVPLFGEVHGFFSHLPHMIISKLRTSNCLLLDGQNLEWALPCRVLRGWDEHARTLISDSLLQKHLGLGYLNKEVILSDTLSKVLGVQDYGPKILVDILSSLCCATDGIKLLGLDWLSSWLCEAYSSLSVHNSGHSSVNSRLENELVNRLKRIPFIPLSDGSYSSVADDPIWLPCDALGIRYEGKHSPKDFPHLYAKLRIVDPLLFRATSNIHGDEIRYGHLIQMLCKVGVQELSAHQVIKSHILVTISDGEHVKGDKNLMVEYLLFIMLHFQCACSSCHTEKEDIISVLQKKPVVLTNHGYICPMNAPIHFGKEYGNPADIGRLIEKTDAVWHEIDVAYLNHPVAQSLSLGVIKWRDFFHELGITDFVQVNSVHKNLSDVQQITAGGMVCQGDLGAATSCINDWESPEMVSLLSMISQKGSRGKCIYLMDVLDKLWDNCYSSKARSYITTSGMEKKQLAESSFMKCLRELRWIASSLDDELHHPEDLFHDCEQVRSILGNLAPYAVPQVTSRLLLKDIGFKTQVSLNDALSIFHLWRMSKAPFITSTAQMLKFYAHISDMISKEFSQIAKEFISSPFIFIPLDNASRSSDSVTGMLLTSDDVYWHDPTGCVDKMKEMILLCTSSKDSNCLPCKALVTFYPSLHDFFVKKCGVQTVPSFGGYLHILLQLSTIALPSQSAHLVFQVFLKWADDFNSGLVSTEEVFDLKEHLLKLENKVLPTLQDRWVSLHPAFGLICWSDDAELKEQFKHADGVDFLQFGEVNNKEKDMSSGKVAMFLQKLGVPVLSQVVSREAIFYGTTDNREKASLIKWLLPYAQRYIYKLYPNLYFNMKQLGFEKLTKLKLVVVEKLFYKYTLKGHDGNSKKRFECTSLFQGNILYVTTTSDFHSIFLELSRLFFDGATDLHLANFLHMITTMAQAGSTNEQTEFFIFNSQKVPMLPAEEPVWSLSLPSALDENQGVQPCVASMNSEHKISTFPRKPGISPNWPPTDWKNAPDFLYARMNHLRTRPGLAHCDNRQDEFSKPPEAVSPVEDHLFPIEIEGDFVIEECPPSTSTIVLEDAARLEDQACMVEQVDFGNKHINFSLKNEIKVSDSQSGLDTSMTDSTMFLQREKLCLHKPDENQTRKTGRLGEMASYKYFAEKLGSGNVKWVNEETETGLPYDLIVGDEESREYVEVKATRSASKDWFQITVREWQFAVAKGDAFSIAHVILLSPNKAKISILKNPMKLCQQNALSLALLMSKQLRDSSVTT